MRRAFKIIVYLLILMFVINILFNVKIKNIDIVGNNKVSDAEIVTSLFENEFERVSLVFFIKNNFGKKKTIPLISSYNVSWITPFSIKVNVNENKAVAFMKRDLRNVYFDKDGTIIESTEERRTDVIEVMGVSFRNYEKGEKIDIQNKKLLNAILNISTFLTEYNLHGNMIEIDSNENFSIYIDNIIVFMGNTDNMEIKLLRLNDIFPKISTLSGRLDLSNAKENMLDEQYIFKKTS